MPNSALIGKRLVLVANTDSSNFGKLCGFRHFRRIYRSDNITYTWIKVKFVAEEQTNIQIVAKFADLQRFCPLGCDIIYQSTSEKKNNLFSTKHNQKATNK